MYLSTFPKPDYYMDRFDAMPTLIHDTCMQKLITARDIYSIGKHSCILISEIWCNRMFGVFQIHCIIFK